jgi:hypothetical protein
VALGQLVRAGTELVVVAAVGVHLQAASSCWRSTDWVSLDGEGEAIVGPRRTFVNWIAGFGEAVFAGLDEPLSSGIGAEAVEFVLVTDNES